MLDCKQSELGTGRGSYAVALLVSPLVSLTIAKFVSLSERCFVVALFSALYVYYFQMSGLYIGQAMSTLQFYGNIAEMAMHAQAVDTRPFLSFPRGLGTRLL